MDATGADDNDDLAVDNALARAVLYRTLSIGLQPPTAERLRQAGARDRFTAAVAALRHLDRHTAGGSLDTVAASLSALTPPAGDEVASAFVRLFGHTTRGLVCPCETEYGPDNGFHQPQQLADIAGYYLAFGLRPAGATDIRADHIACECEFEDFLNRKIAALVADRSDPDDRQATLDATRRAARSFLRDHLARFGCAFATRLMNEDRDGYFGALGQLLLGLLESECTRLGIAAGASDLAVRPETPDGAPLACGTADELIQIRRSS